MSNQNEKELSLNPELDNQPTLDQLQEKLNELTSALDSEKKSKERILDESKKYKESYQSVKAEKEARDKQKALEEEERLRKEGQFQTLLEQREARLKEMEERLESTTNDVKARDEAITNFRKASAFEKALGGKLRKEGYWNHVDFDAIAINPETGAIDKDSLSAVAGNFIKEYKELIDFGNPANLPNHEAGGSKALSYEQWQQLPLPERKKRMKDVKR